MGPIRSSLAMRGHTNGCNASGWQINDALLRTLEAEREGTPVDVGDIGDINTDSSKNIEEAAPLLDLEGGKDVVAVAGKVK